MFVFCYNVLMYAWMCVWKHVVMVGVHVLMGLPRCMFNYVITCLLVCSCVDETVKYPNLCQYVYFDNQHDSADFPADVLRRLVDQLFRSLSHPCKRVIQRAKLGLAKLLKHQIIPKEQVQQCTRPFLLPLGKPQSVLLLHLLS